jgi:hypothetical protein
MSSRTPPGKSKRRSDGDSSRTHLNATDKLDAVQLAKTGWNALMKAAVVATRLLFNCSAKLVPDGSSRRQAKWTKILIPAIRVGGAVALVETTNRAAKTVRSANTFRR